MQHHSLILLEQFVGEFGRNLEEGQIGRRPRRIVGILQRIGSEEDPISVQGSDGFTIFQGVQTERQGEPFGQFLIQITMKSISVRNFSSTLIKFIFNLLELNEKQSKLCKKSIDLGHLF